MIMMVVTIMILMVTMMIVTRMVTGIKSRKCQGTVLFIVGGGEGRKMLLMILIGDW